VSRACVAAATAVMGGGTRRGDSRNDAAAVLREKINTKPTPPRVCEREEVVKCC
jgi:hypothetical protein